MANPQLYEDEHGNVDYDAMYHDLEAWEEEQHERQIEMEMINEPEEDTKRGL